MHCRIVSGFSLLVLFAGGAIAQKSGPKCDAQKFVHSAFLIVLGSLDNIRCFRYPRKGNKNTNGINTSIAFCRILDACLKSTTSQLDDCDSDEYDCLCTQYTNVATYVSSSKLFSFLDEYIVIAPRQHH